MLVTDTRYIAARSIHLSAHLRAYFVGLKVISLKMGRGFGVLRVYPFKPGTRFGDTVYSTEYTSCVYIMATQLLQANHETSPPSSHCPLKGTFPSQSQWGLREVSVQKNNSAFSFACLFVPVDLSLQGNVNSFSMLVPVCTLTPKKTPYLSVPFVT